MAFVRRWDFVFLQCPKQRFCTEGTRDKLIHERKLETSHLHKTKVVNGKEVLDIDYVKNIWEFHEWDWQKGETKGKPCMSYDEVQEAIIQRHKNKQIIARRYHTT